MPYNVEDVMNKIKEKLTYFQKEMFSKTCFGAFLNITKFTHSPQLLHNLMCSKNLHHHTTPFYFPFFLWSLSNDPHNLYSPLKSNLVFQPCMVEFYFDQSRIRSTVVETIKFFRSMRGLKIFNNLLLFFFFQIILLG